MTLSEDTQEAQGLENWWLPGGRFQEPRQDLEPYS